MITTCFAFSNTSINGRDIDLPTLPAHWPSSCWHSPNYLQCWLPRGIVTNPGLWCTLVVSFLQLCMYICMGSCLWVSWLPGWSCGCFKAMSNENGQQFFFYHPTTETHNESWHWIEKKGISSLPVFFLGFFVIWIVEHKALDIHEHQFHLHLKI